MSVWGLDGRSETGAAWQEDNSGEEQPDRVERVESAPLARSCNRPPKDALFLRLQRMVQAHASQPESAVLSELGDELEQHATNETDVVSRLLDALDHMLAANGGLRAEAAAVRRELNAIEDRGEPHRLPRHVEEDLNMAELLTRKLEAEMGALKAKKRLVG